MPTSRVPVLLVCVLVMVGCDLLTDMKDKRTLEILVNRGATRNEVAREFGEQYTFLEKGTSSWKDLDQFLNREPPSALRPLRENASRYPKIMYYTTMWRMTWVFLDEKDMIRAYYVTAQ